MPGGPLVRGALVLGLAVSMLACYGPPPVVGNPGGGGTGTGSGTGGGVGGGVGGGGGAGGGGSASCATSCAAALTDNSDLCATVTGASKDGWDALIQCSGTDTACAADCATFNQGGAIDSACATCLQQGACSVQFTTCSNDA